MSGEKRYPASDLKLERLRNSGIVPVSQDVTEAAVIAGLLIVVMMLLHSQTGIFAPVVFWVRELPLSSYLDTFFHHWWASCARTIIPIATIVFLVGLFQTRFLFRISLLKLDFGRLWGSPRGFMKGILSGVVALVKVIAWGGVSMLLVINLFRAAPELVGEPQASQQSALLAIGSQLINTLSVGAAFCVFVAILAGLLQFSIFGASRSMTRAEVEAELRETELAPEYKRAEEY